MKDTVYILDSYGLIFRSYYAFIAKPLINKNHQNVSAVFGFFRNLFSLIKSEKPRCIIAAMDSKTKTFRHEMYEQYKATRQKTPEDLHAQIPMIEEVLSALGIPVLRADGFEADDIIATVSDLCKEKNIDLRILSGDKDLMQLVDSSTIMMRPGKTAGYEKCDINDVKAQWGVAPEKMLDILSLVGDTADNVPGVKGIGEKTAVKLLEEYGSLDGIYEHASEIGGAVGNKIRDGKESAFFSRELIKLRYDVPIKDEFQKIIAPVFLSDKKDAPSDAAFNYTEAARKLFTFDVPQVAKECIALGGSLKLSELAENIPENTERPGTEQTAQEVPDIMQGVVQNDTSAYKALTSEGELHAFIDDALKADYIAFDCETDDLNTLTCSLAGFSLCYEKGKAVYVPLAQKSNAEMDLFSEIKEGLEKEKAFKELRRLFCNAEKTLVMHNAKFDYSVLISQKAFLADECSANIVDTMLACYLLESDRNSFALENLAERKLGLKGIEYKDLVPKGQTFMDLPLEKAYPYAAEDADFTFQLWTLFKDKMAEEPYKKLFYSIEMPLMRILSSMESEGIRIEKNELAEYGKELKKELDSKEKEIFAVTGHEFNIASPKQLSQVLFEERGLTPTKKTKTGFSTDTSVLEELAALDEVPQKILEYRALAKLLSTYVEALPLLADKNSRVHTSFIQTGTATGRLSSRDPNLQNIPVREEAGRKIRSAFCAPEGRMLVSADYSQIELVILAHLSNDKNLVDAFNSGIDVHKSTASLIYGTPMEEVTAEMRRTAKTINFGVMYGMSSFGLAQSLKIPRARAADFKAKYEEMYSGVTDFFAKTISSCEESGRVETIFGRRRSIPQINSRNKTEKAAQERIAKNTPIQGSAADIVKLAMIKVFNSLKKTYPDAKMLLQVHDEIIVECNKEDAEGVAKLMKNEMENVITLNVPLKVSVESGRRWGEFH